MEIIDFAKAREERLEKVAKTKKEPHARYRVMLEALEKEDLTAMECIAQNHALQMVYKSRPDDWLGIRDKQPLRNIFEHLGYELE